MLLAICTAQVKKKESKNENEKKNKVTKNLLQGDSNPDHLAFRVRRTAT